MTTYYFDSSALVKLYIPEPGSIWVDRIVNAKDQNDNLIHLIVFSKIGIVEVAAAIARNARIGLITTDRKKSLYHTFLRDIEQLYETIIPSNALIHLADDLTQRFALRGYDALHLASALTLDQQLKIAGSSPLVFVSADEKLCQASTFEGLLTENPNNHA